MRKYFLIVFLFSLIGCDKNVLFEQNISFKNEKWHKDSTLLFEVNIDDSMAVYNMYINNRINGQYRYSNMYLFINTQLPYNKKMHDTLECVLAEPSGKWLGKGFGNIITNQILYRKNIRFPYAGKYTFVLEQAMRDTVLQHVLDAGIRIEKAKL